MEHVNFGNSLGKSCTGQRQWNPIVHPVAFLTSNLPSASYLLKDKTNQIKVECIKDLLTKRLLYYLNQVTHNRSI